MAKVKRFHWLISRKQIEEMGVAAILDMLRYDSAQVECNPPSGFYQFSADRPPTVERWRSFSVRVHVVTTDEWRLRELAEAPASVV